MKYVLLAAALLCAGYMLVNLPSCEGGGAKRVNGEWVSYETLSSASLSWPRSPATIASSQLKKSSRTGTGVRTEHVDFRVRYEFAVNGERYEGSEVQFVVATHKQMEGWAKQYPEGKRIEVSYDPENPRLSVIIPGGRQ